MYSFNIILTEICNANCTHCYMKNDNKIKRTLTKRQIDTIINKLPLNTKKIVLTGGEIFLVKNLLMYTIDKIKEKYNNIEIELESNGIYFYKSNNTLKLFKELDTKGVSAIRFSIDPFHESGGVDLYRVKGLKKYQDNLNIEIKYLVQEKALGIGEASKLNSNQKSNNNCMNHSSTKNNPYFFIDIEGNIYLCAWKCIPPIGNIFKDNMNTVIRRLEEDFFSLILIGKIEDAYSLINENKKEEYIQYVRENGQCMLCYKISEKRNNNK